MIKSHNEFLAARARVKIFGGHNTGDERELRDLYPGCELFPSAFPSRWFRTSGLMQALTLQASRFDVLHAHMLWDHSTWATWRAATRASKPFIVTPHGTIINTTRWRPLHKGLYRHFLMDKLFADCSFLHALNEREERACHDFGVKCPIRVIPNGLPKSEYHKERTVDEAWERWPVLKNRRVLLFMGRVAPLKGMDLLPKAWADCLRITRDRDWLLVVAGPDYRGFSAVVANQVRDCGLEDRLLLTGPVYGSLKDSLLASAEAFVLPSYTEGFSVALLEASAARLPSIYTTECHFPALAEAGGGWNIALSHENLTKALADLVNLSVEKIAQMGRAANALGLEKYTMENVCLQLLDMYRDAWA